MSHVSDNNLIRVREYQVKRRLVRFIYKMIDKPIATSMIDALMESFNISLNENYELIVKDIDDIS